MKSTTTVTPAEVSAGCPLCGAKQFEPSFIERGFHLRCCSRCDLFYIWPYPGDAELRARVSTYAYDDLEVIDPEGQFKAQNIFYKGLFPKLQPFIVGAQSVLDVGAGAGNLLMLAAQVAPEADLYGVELNRDRANYLRKHVNARVYEASVLDMPEERTFDVITLINVFSHIPAASLFTKLVRLMHSGSRLIMRVTEMKANVAKSDMHDWEIPDHIQFLGMRTVEHAARLHNMSIEFHERVPIADAIFTRDRFAAQGTSRLRNMLKRIILAIPFSLPMARLGYKLVKGERLYSSVIVLQYKG